jgi:hypothetical protein
MLEYRDHEIERAGVVARGQMAFDSVVHGHLYARVGTKVAPGPAATLGPAGAYNLHLPWRPSP